MGILLGRRLPMCHEFRKIVMNNPLKNTLEAGFALNDKWVAIKFISVHPNL